MPPDPSGPTSHVGPQVLHVPAPAESANVAVYGIGHAGAGAAPWNAVAEFLSPDVEVRAYRLPGRENRFRESAHESIEAAAAELAEAIARRLDDDGRPYLVAGVCSGALIGRVALELIARNHPDAASAALGLVVIDQRAPTTSVSELSTLSAAQLRQWLREHGGTAAEILDDDRLFAFYEPALRTDLRMAEAYLHGPERLAPPMLLVRGPGQQDEDLDLAAWRSDAAGPVHVIDSAAGGGLLLGTDPRELAATLKAAVETAETVRTTAQRIPEEARQ